jgi:thymidylate synthase (FAD)
MVVTGNLRAWRDVLGKRWHEAADAEIKEFAGLVLGHLRSIAPNSFQDVPETPYAY